MKIMFVTPYFYPRIGGLEHYAGQIARGLAERGHEVHIVTSGDRSLAATEQWEGMTIHRLRSLFVVSNTPVHPLWPFQLRRLLREIQPDVINVHAPVPSLAVMAALVAGRTRLVTTYHAGSMKKGRLLPDLLIGLYENIALPWLLHRSAVIICASKFVQDEFLSNWRHKSTVITPGVDANRFVPDASAVKTGQMVFVGDFNDARKGLDVLLEAIKQVPEATLRVIGPGPAKSQARVDFTGPLTGDALVHELQAAHALVLPSTTNAESFGMVLIEAMAAGRPVIGSDIGGIPSVISHEQTGLLVPAGNAKALAAAIKRLLTDNALTEKLGKAARRNVEDEYTWTCRIDTTEETLRQTTEVHRG